MIDTIKKKILNCLCKHPFWMKIVPDKTYLIWLWQRNMGYPIDIDNPKTLNEKMQWLKLHDRKPLNTTLVDKYEAKIWLSQQFGSDHIVPSIAVYNQSSEIDLEKLPNSFVIKCNHDCGNVYICYDKSTGVFYDKHMKEHSFQDVCCRLDAGLKVNFFYGSREWPYKNVKRRIFCEELLLQQDGSLPNDYKLFFINGKLQFTYVSYDRAGADDRCTYDAEWNRLPFVWVDQVAYHKGMNTSNVPCPASYDDMKEFGAKIASNFYCVRVDFYDVDGKMYFGEITPFHSAGYSPFTPVEYDRILGERLVLN